MFVAARRLSALRSSEAVLALEQGMGHRAGTYEDPYMMQNKTHLRPMYLHDALGKNDHLALGTGELTLDKYLALAKEQNCRIVLETKAAEA